mmetsp:Transcript_118039/g.338596  ORF Transcript_118039/g.338596 Transcript_118039/m.338596 type:complete len:451 (+) Transcript_118039:87-1439(+)
MTAISPEDAAKVRTTWSQFLAEGLPPHKGECYSSAVLRTIPAWVQEELSRKIMLPQASRRQQRNREFGVSPVDDHWAPAPLAPGIERVPFIREKVYRLLIAVAKWDPKVSTNVDIFDLEVALVAGSSCERISFSALARLYMFFRMHSAAEPRGEPAFESTLGEERARLPEEFPPGLLPKRAARSGSTTPSVTSLPISLTATWHSGSRLGSPACDFQVPLGSPGVWSAATDWPDGDSEAGSSFGDLPEGECEDVLADDVVEVWKILREEWPEVARACRQDRRTLEAFVLCVRTWLQTLFAVGCSTSEEQLCAYVPLLTYMVGLATIKPAQVDARRELCRIAVAIIVSQHKRIEALTDDCDGMLALLRNFAKRPPIHAQTLAAAMKSSVAETDDSGTAFGVMLVGLAAGVGGASCAQALTVLMSGAGLTSLQWPVVGVIAGAGLLCMSSKAQ